LEQLEPSQITKTIPEQRTGKGRNQGTTEKKAILCTAHIMQQSNSVKVHKLGNNITCSTNCNYRIAATPYTVETCFTPDIQL